MAAEGWERVVSRSTGKHFWFNQSTGQSAWDLEALRDESGAVQGKWLAREARGRPGVLFYEHALTGEVRYEVPAGEALVTASVSGSRASTYTVYGSSAVGEAKVEALAAADLLTFVETLARVDERLGEVLAALPSALRRTIESDGFRANANARFAELSFLAVPAAVGTLVAVGLSVEELAPQASALLAGKAWAPFVDATHVARCLVRFFGSPANGSATATRGATAAGSREAGSAHSSNSAVTSGGGSDGNVVLKRVGFQRLLAAVTITDYLERRAAAAKQPPGQALPSLSPSASSAEVRALVGALVAGRTHGAPSAAGAPIEAGPAVRSADADAEAAVAAWAKSLAATVANEVAGGGEDGCAFDVPVVVCGFSEAEVEGAVAAATDRQDVPFQEGSTVTVTVRAQLRVDRKEVFGWGEGGWPSSPCPSPHCLSSVVEMRRSGGRRAVVGCVCASAPRPARRGPTSTSGRALGCLTLLPGSRNCR